MMDGHMMPANDSIAMMMMQMTFYAGVDCTVLINQWKVCLFCLRLACYLIYSLLHWSSVILVPQRSQINIFKHSS